jgi:hypothetical protein
MMMKILFASVAVVTLLAQGLGAALGEAADGESASSSQSSDGRFLRAVTAYADTMLEKGRDRWGEPSPLFALLKLHVAMERP